MGKERVGGVGSSGQISISVGVATTELVQHSSEKSTQRCQKVSWIKVVGLWRLGYDWLEKSHGSILLNEESV